MNFKKKFVGFLLISSTVILSSASLVLANTLGSVNANNVNVRVESNTNSDVFTKFGTGQALDIVGFENGFFKVNVDSAELYISAEFVDILKANGSVAGDNVNVRINASMESDVLGKLGESDEVVVVGCKDNWLKIEYNGSVAYVNKEFISGDYVGYISGNMDDSPAAVTISPKIVEVEAVDLESVYAVVSSETGLRLRSEANTESKVLTLIPSGVVLDILEQRQGWIKVNFAGYEGYVSDEFITLSKGVKPTISGSGIGYQIVDYGKQFLGTPYLWAGNDLNKGVDCSGFVYNVFKNFGIGLNRSSSAMASNGYAVSKSDLQAGDLVLFDTTGSNNGGISHVGIYMGDGRFIHSSSSTKTWGVVISSLSEDYYIRTYVTARRVL